MAGKKYFLPIQAYAAFFCKLATPCFNILGYVMNKTISNMKNRNDGCKLKSFEILRSFLRYEFVIDSTLIEH